VTKLVSSGFLPFALPDIGEDEIAEVVDTLRSGWLTSGPKTRQFEEAFTQYLGGGVESLAVNSATAGLHLALEAIGVGTGDEVLVPTHTFTATAEVVRYLGADPKFVDIDSASYCMDPGAVESALTGKTRAILPVHFAGLPADMDRLLALARKHDLKIIEDAAHAFPAKFGGQFVGTLPSDCTVFSFYATKTLATGEGGMLVTRNGTIAQRARIMRLHGIDRDAFDRYTSSRPAWYYEVVAPGFKYNLTDVAAAIGLQQLKKADRFNARRAALAARYIWEFSDLPIVLPPMPGPNVTHSWHLFVVQITEKAKLSRDEAITQLYSAGIGCSVHYVPLHLQPYWRDRYCLTPEEFPNSQRLYERGISLPIYTKMTDEDQDRVISAFRALF
jgi:dTDP-4-amino-4,6-dideoxygalactose transaminase